ncbi:MAG: ORF6N domain-containing protein [Terriglobia bacterium]
MKRPKSQLAAAALPVSIETMERRIYLIRSQKIMLDSDLADLYQVPTKSLNLAVRRNADRFPEDFMFQLTKEEVGSLRFQFETSNKGRGGRRYLPHAFTEHGVAMLSSVLNSKRAVQVNILIIRAFVKLREMLSTHKDLARKLEDLEKKYETHDVQIKAVFDAIRKLIEPPVATRRRIGFATQPQK